MRKQIHIHIFADLDAYQKKEKEKEKAMDIAFVRSYILFYTHILLFFSMDGAGRITTDQERSMAVIHTDKQKQPTKNDPYIFRNKAGTD